MIEKIKHLNVKDVLSQNLVEKELLNPEKVFIQLETPRSKSFTLTVNEGDEVKAQQIVGVRDCGFYKENIIATVSGIVGKVEKRFTSMGKIASVLPITNDFKNTLDSRVKNLTDEQVFALSKEEILSAVSENAVKGMGGAGFPTAVKLATKDQIDTIVVNGIECEPGLKTDFETMVLDPESILKGLKLALKATNAKKAVIGIKKTKQAAVDAMTKALANFSDLNASISLCEDYYPQGWEVELVKNTTGINIQGVIPSTKGIVELNVNTLKAIYLACAKNEAVSEIYLTINGEVKEPCIVKARVGLTYADCLALAGGYTNENNKTIVLGGPMMGSCILLDNACLNELNSSILVFNAVDRKEENCVRCASCVKSCPAGLSPVQIMNRVKAGDKDTLVQLKVKSCIECGLCTYVCTSGIHVTDFIRKAKQMVK